MEVVMNKSESGKLHVALFSRLVGAVRLVWEASPNLSTANIVLIFLIGVLPLAKLYLLKLVIDGITSAVTATDKSAAFNQVMVFITIAGIVVLFSYVCNALGKGVKMTLGQMVSDHMNDIIHAKAIELDLEYYEDDNYYDKLDLVNKEAPFRPVNIVNSLVNLGQNGVSLVVIVGLITTFHWAIPAILLVATVPGVLFRLRYAGEMHQWRIQTSEIERRGGYLRYLLLNDLHAKEIRLFDLGRLFMERFRELRNLLLKEKIKIIIKQSAGELVTFTGGTLAVYACYAYMAYCAIHGKITIGDLVMYVGAFQRGDAALQSLITSTMSLYENGLFISTISSFLELNPKVGEPRIPRQVPNHLKSGIVFNNVSFRYPKSNRIVLERINLTIRSGEVIGLVGENGSGKTTLIKLLCRFYDPVDGSIEMDGINIKHFETRALRRQVSMVFQDYNRYHTSVRENIWYGDINLSADDEKIKKAGEEAGIDEVIANFHEGYETVIGKWFKRGEELSAGESQKLALARALLRNAQIMVLDEPTSAMDAKAEYNLFKRFRQVAKGRTIILISHRLSTLKMADRIYVLKNRTIVESGSHAELVANNGTYAELFKTQAQGYL